MLIRAVKGTPHNKFFVTRDDASQVSWTWPREQDFLPHDLCHLVMEKAFGLKYGVYGLMAIGVNWKEYEGPAAYQRADAFVKEKTDENADQLIAAETVANVPRGLLIMNEFTPENFLNAIHVSLESAKRPVPETINPENCVIAMKQFEELSARWKELKDGEWIDLEWP